jgi:hypothetical protein
MKRDKIINLAGKFSVFILLFVATLFAGCDNKNKSGSGQENVSVNNSINESAEAEKLSSDSAAGSKTVQSVNEDVKVNESDNEKDKENQEAKEASSAGEGSKEGVHPVFMGVWGGVGGTGFMLDMNGTTGSYIPYDMAEAKEYGERRQLKLVSYDSKSGLCIINAYLKGKYIGQFKGTFEEAEVKMDGGGSYSYQAYSGVFTSEKGAKLNFNFHFD